MVAPVCGEAWGRVLAVGDQVVRGAGSGSMAPFAVLADASIMDLFSTAGEMVRSRVAELRKGMRWNMSVQVSCAGMVDPVNAANKSNVQSAVVEGRTLELRQGDIGGVQHAWARLSGAHDGDAVWLEISGDGGKTWLQCGLRVIRANERNYTDAQRTTSDAKVCMRAGAQLAGPRYETAAWC
jgi:hypothetical protein